MKLSDFEDGTFMVLLEESKLAEVPLCPTHGTKLLPQLTFSKNSMLLLQKLTSLRKHLKLYIC